MKAIQLLGTAEIAISSDAASARDALVFESAGISEIVTVEDLSTATETMRKLKDCTARVESCRAEVKAPVLDWGRKIDSLAKTFVESVDKEIARLRGLMNAYAVEQKRKADEAEKARQAELKRIEDEKRAAEDAERKRQAEVAEAEASAKKAAEAEANAFSEEDEATAKKEREESERVAAQKQAEAETERLRQVELSEQQAKASVLPVAAIKPSGLTIKEVWKFEVVNIDEVYASNPTFVRMEVNAAAVNAAIRSGARTIPGLKIWSETETGVRR